MIASVKCHVMREMKGSSVMRKCSCLFVSCSAPLLERRFFEVCLAIMRIKIAVSIPYNTLLLSVARCSVL